MKVLGIIPARGGSKGVPGKNIMEFDGKPLLAYAIEAGKKSKLISKMIVNTDDMKIAQISEDFECEVFIRKKEFATDTSEVIDSVIQTIEFFKKKGEFFDAVMLLQPTSPLRTGEDIDKAIQILRRGKIDAVISMVKVQDKHPARMYKMEKSQLSSLMPEHETERRQDLPELYLRNGCIYLVKTEVLKNQRTFMPTNKSAYIMNADWDVNVDTEIDVIILGQLIKKWKRQVL